MDLTDFLLHHENFTGDISMELHVSLFGEVEIVTNDTPYFPFNAFIFQVCLKATNLYENPLSINPIVANPKANE